MSKSIASYPSEQRKAVVARRLAMGGNGIGYWAARYAANKLGVTLPPTAKQKREKKRNDSDSSPARDRKFKRGHQPFKKLLKRVEV